MKNADQSFVAEIIPLLTNAANYVRLTKNVMKESKEELEKFIAAEAFGGAKPGYEFRVGPEGLGYYLSNHKESKEWSVDRLYFALRRLAGQEALMEPQFLFASTLSTTLRGDMKGSIRTSKLGYGCDFENSRCDDYAFESSRHINRWLSWPSRFGNS